MSRPKVYDERTGDPFNDNRARKMNKALDRSCRGLLRVNARGRGRRAQIMRAEYRNYLAVVAAVADVRMADDGIIVPVHSAWVDANLTEGVVCKS